MQIPIINHHKFQASENNVYTPKRKNVLKRKVRYYFYFSAFIIKFDWFIAWGMLSDKYTEMPDLTGKTEKEAEKY